MGFFRIHPDDRACEAVNVFGMDVATWVVCIGQPIVDDIGEGGFQAEQP